MYMVHLAPYCSVVSCLLFHFKFCLGEQDRCTVRITCCDVSRFARNKRLLSLGLALDVRTCLRSFLITAFFLLSTRCSLVRS